MTNRFLWPHSTEQSSLYQWRVSILASMMLAGLVFGIFALVAGVMLAVRQNVWGLAIADIAGLVLWLILICVHHIRFEVRAGIATMAAYCIGIAVILLVGPLSGGPIWLFTFAVLAGVLLGNRAAVAAIFMNALALTLIAVLMSKGMIGSEFPFFKTTPAAVAAVVNFIMLNAITAVSVSSLLRGLNTSVRQYQLMADNVADVIWTMDMNLGFTYVSPSVFQMQGYTAREMMGKTVKDILSPESLERVHQLLSEKMDLLGQGDAKVWQPVIFEAEQRKKDGSVLWTSVNARLIRGQQDQPAGILGVTRDITVQKQNEIEKRKAQIAAGENKKLALVGRIAGKMAHDFNNVLGIIMGHSELALTRCRDEEDRKTFELIVSQTLRGKNLTKNLIAFAKSHEPNWKWFLLNEKIDFVLDLLKTDLDGITIKKEWDKDVDIMADPGMIEHTLVNLVHNAVHAVGRSPMPEIILRISLPDSGGIRFEIQDNGCGIPKEYIDEAIFEPSFTLKGSQDTTGAYAKGIKGTGYGMANVKKYIELHKGRIRVESEEGAGTRVIIDLPRIEKRLTIEEKTNLESVRPLSGRSILLVEDEPAIALVQQHMLTEAPLNHIVDTASSGQAALRLFGENHYDLVSLDHVLPGKLNGKDVYTHIRRLKKDIPVLFISGNIEFLESIKALKQEDPYVDHLSKPCGNMEYVNRVNELLRKAAAKAAG